jgi:hypothetical protein
MNPPPKNFQRKGLYTRISEIWRVIFASLLIDLLINATINHRAATINTPQFSHYALEMASLICAAATLPFLNKALIFNLLSKLRRAQNKSRASRSSSPLLSWGSVILVLVLIVAKLTLLPSFNNLLSVGLALFLIIAAITSARHLLQETAIHAKSLVSSPWLYIPIWERQLIILFSLPIVLARMVSLLGVLSFNCGATYIFPLITTITSAILLLAMKPERRSFVGICKNCLAPAPIAYVEYGACPRCGGFDE